MPDKNVKSKRSPKKSQNQKNNSKNKRKKSSDSQLDQEQQLTRDNNRLRKQLVKLSKKLDEVIEKAAKNKMKAIISPVITTTKQSQTKQLQIAQKMIDRLQKTIRDYQSKQAYTVSFRRITDLEQIIKKKQAEIDKLQIDIRDSNRQIKAKNLSVNQLLSQQQAPINVNQNKQKIEHLQQKIRKIMKENQYLSKKQHDKEEKLFIAKSKMNQLQWFDEQHIGRSQHLLDELQRAKRNYKESMEQVQKQNRQITTLNIKLSETQRSKQDNRKRPPRSHHSSPRQISRSLQQLIPNSRYRKQSLASHLPDISRRYQ